MILPWKHRTPINEYMLTPDDTKLSLFMQTQTVLSMVILNYSKNEHIVEVTSECEIIGDES
jgi:hypothetical protein